MDMGDSMSEQALTSAMKVYISGPISGFPDGNRQQFSTAAAALRQCGFETINPHDVCQDVPADALWLDYMRECIKAMMDADAVFVLGGWIDSRGAYVEVDLANQLSIPVFGALPALRKYAETRATK